MATYERNDIVNFQPRLANFLHDRLIGWFGLVGNEVLVEVDGSSFHIRLTSDVLTQQQIEDTLNGVGVLTVTTDKTTITANGTDTATITCSDPIINGDSDVLINAWLNGEIYAENIVDSLVGGQSISTLATNQPGTYLIEIRRNTGTDYETGYVEIEAN